MKKFALLSLVVLLFVACDNDDDTSNLEQYVDIATVENPDQVTDFIFVLDDSTRIKTSNSLIPYYRPKDGQRLIVNYSLLYKTPDSLGYAYKAQINDIYEILTKGIFNITPETQDSIGDDYVYIDRMWIANRFLNVEFVYPGYNKMHYINLVYDSTKTYTDGKVHLEFRHNSNGDYPSYNKYGIVSFNLSSLETNAVDSVQLVVHANEYDHTPSATTYNLTYKFGSTTNAGIKPNKLILENLDRKYR